MRVVACVVLCCCVATPCAATTLFRCVSADGGVSYQDVACVDAQVETRRISVAPEVRSGKRSGKARSAKARSGGKPAARNAAASRTDSRSRARAACVQARHGRDAILERAGLERTFELLRKLDDDVLNACKGL